MGTNLKQYSFWKDKPWERNIVFLFFKDGVYESIHIVTIINQSILEQPTTDSFLLYYFYKTWLPRKQAS